MLWMSQPERLRHLLLLLGGQGQLVEMDLIVEEELAEGETQVWSDKQGLAVMAGLKLSPSSQETLVINVAKVWRGKILRRRILKAVAGMKVINKCRCRRGMVVVHLQEQRGSESGLYLSVTIDQTLEDIQVHSLPQSVVGAAPVGHKEALVFDDTVGLHLLDFNDRVDRLNLIDDPFNHVGARLNVIQDVVDEKVTAVIGPFIGDMNRLLYFVDLDRRKLISKRRLSYAKWENLYTQDHFGRHLMRSVFLVKSEMCLLTAVDSEHNFQSIYRRQWKNLFVGGFYVEKRERKLICWWIDGQLPAKTDKPHQTQINFTFCHF
jgi:hypothetical protein